MRIVPAWPLATGFTLTAGALLAVALAFAVISISTVLMSIFLAAFLALGMAPAVSAISRRGVPRAWSVVVVAILVFVVPATVGQLVHALQHAPEAIATLTSTAWFTSLEDTLNWDSGSALAQGAESVTTPESLLAISGGVLRVGLGVVGAVSSAFIVVVLTLYFVSSLDAIKRSAASLVPANRRERFSTLLEKITTSVGRAVAGGILLSTINAAVVFLFVGTVGALFVSPTAALVFFIAYLAYIQIEAYVVTPRILGRAVEVTGVLVIIGAMIGATLFGLLGALLAIPVTASILIVIRDVAVPRLDAQVRAPVS